MPRAKQVTMGKVTPREAHEAAIALAVKRHKPYAVTKSEFVNYGEDQHAVVFTAPMGGDRKVVAVRNKRANAVKLRELLEEAWAEGMWAAAQKGNIG